MNAIQAVRLIRLYQEASMVINGLHLEDYKYPEQATVKNGDEKDFIVVGGGTAGSVVAARLAEDKKSQVLVIEAGGNPPVESTIPALLILLEKSRVDWNFTQENDNVNQQCAKTQKTADQGKMLGGTSSFGYLLYDQGSYEDYDLWAKIVNDSTWSYKNIIRYIKKSENIENYTISASNRAYFGVGGPITITKENHCQVNDYLNAFAELGYKIAPEMSAANPSVYAPHLYTIGNYKRQSTAKGYLSRAKNWGNLQVLKNAEVVKIIFSIDKKAVAVKVRTENGIITVKAKKEIIVCAGAINTPKLLMLSGIGPKKDLNRLNIRVIKDLPVGKNLQDHAAVLLTHNMKKLTESPVSPNPGVFPAYTFAGQVDKNHHCHGYRTLNFVNLASYLVAYCRFTYGYCCKICNKLFANRGENQFLWTFLWNLKPKSRGKVVLKNNDYATQPLIYVNHLDNQEDIDDMVQSIISFNKVNETDFFKKAGAEFLDPRLQPCQGLAFGSQKYWACYIKCMISPQRDYCCTCAAGSVVDSRFKVHGIKKLRVVDSSVLPTLPTGGTLGPTLAIAEEAADIIKQDNDIKVDGGTNLVDDYGESYDDKKGCKKTA